MFIFALLALPDKIEDYEPHLIKNKPFVLLISIVGTTFHSLGSFGAYYDHYNLCILYGIANIFDAVSLLLINIFGGFKFWVDIVISILLAGLVATFVMAIKKTTTSHTIDNDA